MQTRLSASRRSLALAAVAATFAAGTAEADVDTGRDILHTGQRVPGLGRVGTLTASPLGIDDVGRVIVAVWLADGSRAIARVDGGALVPIWRHTEGRDAPDINGAVVSRDGTHVAALGGPQLTGSSSVFTWRVLYDLSSGSEEPLLVAGDRTTDGATIIGVTSLVAINDAGAVLLSARIEAPDVDAESGAEVVLLRDGGETRVIASTIPDAGANAPITFAQAVGFAADGAAILTTCEANWACTVSRYQDGTLMPVIAPGDAAPDGSTISTVSGLAVASNGEVLATVDSERLIVRTENGSLLRVRSATDQVPDGGFFIAGGHMNASGVVTLQLIGVDAHGTGTWRRVALYSPGAAAPELLPEGTDGGQINDAGQIAVRVATAGEAVRVARWQNGGLATVLTARSTTRDGTVAAALGIRAGCLDEDGRIGTLADGIDGSQGWVCIDAAGPHLQTHTARAMEPYVPRPTQCAFGAGGEIVALANGRLERVSDRHQSVLAAGDRLPDGRSVIEITAIDANPDGTLVAVVNTGEDRIVVRQTRGGLLDVVDLYGSNGAAAHDVRGAGIADDGTVVATAVLGSGLAAIATDERGSRVLLEPAAGEPLSLESLRVRGMAAVVSAIRADGTQHHLLFDLTDDTQREILQPDTLPDPRAQVFVLDLSASGEVLYTTAVPDNLFASPTETWIWRDGSSERLRRRDSYYSSAPQPIHLNAVGNVLQYAPVLGARTRLSLSGPPVSAACPGQTTTAAADNDGCQIAPRPSPALWPMLPLAAALLAARRRRHAAARATRTS